MLVHAIVHESCTDTVREVALEVDWEKNPLLHQGLEPASELQLAFQSDALPAELPPLSAKRRSIDTRLRRPQLLCESDGIMDIYGG